MLNDRRAAILRAVVEQYIDTAQPVGSSRIVQATGLKVSPATVRNEMGSLESEGFITQPHTSAGRIPTEKGYRFFVDQLRGDQPLQPIKAQEIGEFFRQAHGELEQLLRDATSLLARLTSTTAVVVSSPEQSAIVRSVQLVSLSDRLLMVVAVLSNGSVMKPRIEVESPLSEDAVAAASKVLSASCVGALATAIKAPSPSGQRDADALALRAFNCLKDEAMTEHSQLFVDGASNMARSFDGAGMVGEILALLEKQFAVSALLNELMARQMTVAIGSETGLNELSECSLVLAPVVAGDTRAGTVAVLGPTRMNYAETLAAVAVVSERLGRALTDGT